MKLLPLNKLIKTGGVDHADWNYQFLLRYIQRQRFRLLMELVGNNHFDNLLEIGYGSGIFLPQLSDYCTNLYGLDIHNQNEKVTNILWESGIQANLFSASAENMAFEDTFFDAIVSISALEFIKDLDESCLEIKRILKKSGSFFVITPGYSKLLDLGFKVLTGKNADTDFEERRQKIIPTLLNHFEIKRNILFPKINLSIKLYTALQLSPIK